MKKVMKTYNEINVPINHFAIESFCKEFINGELDS